MPTHNAPKVNEPSQGTIDLLSTQLQETGVATHFPYWNVPDDDDAMKMHPDWRTAGKEALAAVEQIGAHAKIESAGRMGEGFRHLRITVVKDPYKELRRTVQKNSEGWSEDSRPLRDYTYGTIEEVYAQALVNSEVNLVAACAFELGYRGRATSGRTTLPYISERDPQYVGDTCPTCKSPVAELFLFPKNKEQRGKRLGIRSINSAERVRQEWEDLINFTPEHYQVGEKKILKSYQENGAAEGEMPPIFSEVALYELLGKDGARALLSYLRSLGKSLGFSDYKDLP